jgi:hypothetical protein
MSGNAKPSELNVTHGSTRLVLKSAARGIFFALFSTGVMSIALFRPFTVTHQEVPQEATPITKELASTKPNHRETRSAGHFKAVPSATKIERVKVKNNREQCPADEVYIKTGSDSTKRGEQMEPLVPKDEFRDSGGFRKAGTISWGIIGKVIDLPSGQCEFLSNTGRCEDKKEES